MHIFGYLLKHKKDFKSIINKKGRFYDTLKEFTDIEDGVFLKIIEALTSRINHDGHSIIDEKQRKKTKIICAQEAIKSGDQKLLKTFLPQFFDPSFDKPKNCIEKLYKRLFGKKKKNHSSFLPT